MLERKRKQANQTIIRKNRLSKVPFRPTESNRPTKYQTKVSKNYQNKTQTNNKKNRLSKVSFRTALQKKKTDLQKATVLQKATIP